jgi:hypothetical protein
MSFTLRYAIALIVPILIVASSAAFPQEQPPTARDHAAAPSVATTLPSSSPGLRTAKERLGEKWMDEQRVDNCKVPLDKRGTTLRPDTCPSIPTR